MWRIVFLSFLLTGCAGVSINPLAEPRHPKCVDSSKIKVFQVLDDGILAHLCPVNYPSYYDDAFEACELKGDIVYLYVSPSENNYVDDQKITLPHYKCFMENGTYKYHTKNDIRKTVRKIIISSSQTDNPVLSAPIENK